MTKRKPGDPVSTGRHQRGCTICAHPQRDEIDAAFVGWRSPVAIAAEYEIKDRSSIYRHARCFGLFDQRRKNIRAALERIIEKADGVEVSATALVQAVTALAKINSAGEWIDRTEVVNVSDLFDRMSVDELDRYAKSGEVPGWFRIAMRAPA
jgi:hypothetical protein